MSCEACRELAVLLGLDPDELVEYFGERAAIREFDGGQSRDAAEQGAMDDVHETFAPSLLVTGERAGPRSAASAAAASTRSRAVDED